MYLKIHVEYVLNIYIIYDIVELTPVAMAWDNTVFAAQISGGTCLAAIGGDGEKHDLCRERLAFQSHASVIVVSGSVLSSFYWFHIPEYPAVPNPIGSMDAIYGNIYHQYTPNVSIYTIHGSYGIWCSTGGGCSRQLQKPFCSDSQGSGAPSGRCLRRFLTLNSIRKMPRKS